MVNGIDLIIKDGKIVTSKGVIQSDIGISEGVITHISKNIDVKSSEKSINAKGKFILPGAIDGHTHVYSPPWCFDSFETGTKAAAYGGTTTIVEMPLVNDDQNTTNVKTFLEKKAIGEKDSHTDFALYAGEIQKENELTEIGKLVEEGCVAFKITLGGDTTIHNDGILWEALSLIQKNNSMSTFHSENNELLQYFYKKVENDIKSGKKVNYSDSRPEVCCVDTTQRMILYNKYIGNRVHIAHMSTRAETELVSEAKKRKQLVTAETCPHYLFFDRTVLDKEDARFYVMNPSLKTKADTDALWEGLANGSVDIVTTDHCAYTKKEKDKGKENILNSWAGVAGLEFSYRLMISYGPQGNRLTWEKLVQIMAENPAKIFGLYPRKGVIQVGSDADLIIYNPEGSRKISNDDLRSIGDHTIYEGIKIKGEIEKVLVRGTTVMEDSKVVSKPGFGKFIPSQR
ncbi:MAG: dihydroorotase [Candidatus Ranarchaeia archaeon]